MRVLITCVLIGLISLTGCREHVGDRLLAQVGERKLYESELRKQLPPELASAGNSLLQDAIKQWVNRQLMLEAAKSEGLDKLPEIDAELARLRDELVISKLRDSMRVTSAVTEAMLKEYYRKNSTLWFSAVSEVRGWIWRSPSQADIMAKWRMSRGERAPTGGEEFEWTAITSLGPLGGELSRLSPGSFTEPVKWGRQWAFVQLLDRRPVGTLKPFAEIKPRLQLMYLQDQHRKRLDSLITKVRKQFIEDGEYFLSTSSASKVDSVGDLNRLKSIPVAPPDSVEGERPIEELFMDRPSGASR